MATEQVTTTEPSAAPSADTSSASVADTASSNSGEVDWGDMASHDDDASIDVASPETPAAASPQQTPVSVSPSEPGAVKQDNPASATPVTEQPAQATPAVQPQQSSEPQQQQVGSPQDIASLRQQRTEALTKSYAITEDQAMGIMTDPGKVIPQLAAEIHNRIVDEVFQHLPQYVGQMVQNVQTFNKREAETLDAFYSAWPELKGSEEAVLRVGQMFRAANPNATREVAIQTIGQMTMLSLGKSRQAPQAQQMPNTPAAAPFQPANGGSVGGINSPAPSIWEEMSASEY
jgi:hypothetical protein